MAGNNRQFPNRRGGWIGMKRSVLSGRLAICLGLLAVQSVAGCKAAAPEVYTNSGYRKQEDIA